MRAIILGGSGYIGRSLIEQAFQKKKFKKIINVDIKKPRNLLHFENFIDLSIQDYDEISKIIQSNDLIFNLAGIADIKECNKNLHDCLQNNLISNIKLYEICAKKNVKKYIFASSLYVNGYHGGIYKASKLSSEIFIDEMYKSLKLPYIFIRYGSLVGGQSNYSNGFHKIIYDAYKKNFIQFNGSKESSREYINIEDATSITIDLALKNNKNCAYSIIGNERIKIKNLILMITEIMRKKKIDLKFIKKKDDHYNITPYSPQKNEITIRPSNYIGIEKTIIDLIERFNHEE